MAKNKGSKLPSPPKDKATQAIAGQFATISDQIGRQLGKQGKGLDRGSARILRRLDSIEDQTVSFNRRLMAGAKADEAQFAGTNLVDRRLSSAKAVSKFSTAAAKSTTKQATQTTKAAKSTQRAYKNVASTMNKNAMSLLDVLAAQREAEFQHEILMAQMGFDQSVALAKLQNNLQKDFLMWQIDNGLVETPDEARRNDWVYEKKSQLLSNRLTERQAERENNAPLRQQFITQQDAITDAITESVSAYNSVKAREWARKQVDASTFPTMRDALTRYVRDKIEATVPEGTELSGINSFISDTLEAVNNNEPAPDFKQVKQYIISADPSGQMREYINNHSKMLERYHNDYKQLRFTTSTAPDPKKVTEAVEQGAMSIGTGLVEAGKTAAAAGVVGAGAVALKKLTQGAGLDANIGMAVGEIPSETQGFLQRLQQGLSNSPGGSIQKFINEQFSRMGSMNPFGPPTTTSAAVEAGSGEAAAAVGRTASGISGRLSNMFGDAFFMGGVGLGAMSDEARSKITGESFVDDRGVMFRYDNMQGGFIIDIDSGRAHWDELSDEEKQAISSSDFGTI